MSDILWQPGTERIVKTRMEAFRRFVNQRHTLEIADYPALHQWSIDQRAAFWQAIVDFFDIRFSRSARRGADRRRTNAQRPVVPRRHAELRRTPAAPSRRCRGGSGHRRKRPTGTTDLGRTGEPCRRFFKTA
ncbi:hypothetical protein ACFS4T_20725 [Pseudomonas lini]